MTESCQVAEIVLLVVQPGVTMDVRYRTANEQQAENAEHEEDQCGSVDQTVLTATECHDRRRPYRARLGFATSFGG